MYIFEAVYDNAITDSIITRTIEFDGYEFMNNERDCYLYAMERAYDMAQMDEGLMELRLVAC